ncbi:MAG: GNAT superfamily N-acetyltransferase [Sulfitobacter sp.]|jgi:N-acetylglutamate synthase
MIPTPEQLFEASDQTWPAAEQIVSGPWTLRDGQGGGKRVSAATANAPVKDTDITMAETAMRDLGQTPLFMVRAGEDELDGLLAQRGYEVIDPVTLYVLPIEKLTDTPIPRVTAFAVWEPLAMMAEIWSEGGIGPARLAVMARAKIKTGIFSRWNEKPGGVAFAAVHDDICMVHAVEVRPDQRRQGVAVWMMRKAAFWGRDHGARHLAVLCVAQNQGANALYRALGFRPAGRYHYRQHPA